MNSKQSFERTCINVATEHEEAQTVVERKKMHRREIEEENPTTSPKLSIKLGLISGLENLSS